MMLALDKRLHLAAGFLISLVVGLVVSPLFGFIAAGLAGAAKELLWDWWLGKGTPDWFDFLATLIGATLALLLIMW
jgi:hypothetical protein